MVVRSLFRRSTLLAIAIGCLIVTVATIQADAGGKYHFKRRERCLMRKINKSRISHGLKKATWDKQLGYVARVHAKSMAAKASVWDDAAIGQRVTHWISLGNNTGSGSGCKQLNKAFRASAPHFANMLGHYDYVGVGVKWNNGHMYVSENFESQSNPGNIYGWP